MKTDYKAGDVVQLNANTRNKFFRGALMTVSEPKSFGAQGYIHGMDRGLAYYRAEFSEMEYVGRAAFMIEAIEKGEEE